jgi:hypothetical protein
LQEAEDTYAHVPLLETFVQFQLMTAARRSETLTLTWANVDLEAQTAYLPETKNGRARKLALRSDLVKMLRQLPRTSELVFPIGVDGLRKAWLRICQKTGLTGEHELRIHDLRHEAICGLQKREATLQADFLWLIFSTLAATAISACCCVTPTYALKASPSDLMLPLAHRRNPFRIMVGAASRVAHPSASRKLWMNRLKQRSVPSRTTLTGQ